MQEKEQGPLLRMNYLKAVDRLNLILLLKLMGSVFVQHSSEPVLLPPNKHKNTTMKHTVIKETTMDDPNTTDEKLTAMTTMGTFK